MTPICNGCGVTLAPRDMHMDDDYCLVCGDCYLAGASLQEIAVALLAIEIDTQRAAV